MVGLRQHNFSSYLQTTTQTHTYQLTQTQSTPQTQKWKPLFCICEILLGILDVKQVMQQDLRANDHSRWNRKWVKFGAETNTVRSQQCIWFGYLWLLMSCWHETALTWKLCVYFIPSLFCGKNKLDFWSLRHVSWPMVDYATNPSSAIVRIELWVGHMFRNIAFNIDITDRHFVPVAHLTVAQHVQLLMPNNALMTQNCCSCCSRFNWKNPAKGSPWISIWQSITVSFHLFGG